MKLKKVLVSVGIVGMMAASSVTSVMAAAPHYSYFPATYVNKNSWTNVSVKQKNYSNRCAYLTINNIWKGNGDSSNYQKVQTRIRAASGTSIVTLDSKVATKRVQSMYTWGAGLTSKGSYITLQAKGNDPSLDCQIDGNFAHY